MCIRKSPFRRAASARMRPTTASRPPREAPFDRFIRRLEHRDDDRDVTAA
jgi:hypothetical protein